MRECHANLGELSGARRVPRRKLEIRARSAERIDALRRLRCELAPAVRVRLFTSGVVVQRDVVRRIGPQLLKRLRHSQMQLLALLRRETVDQDFGDFVVCECEASEFALASRVQQSRAERL